VLTCTNNRAAVNETKAANRGSDGKVYFLAKHGETSTMSFQVKFGGVNRRDGTKTRVIWSARCFDGNIDHAPGFHCTRVCGGGNCWGIPPRIDGEGLLQDPIVTIRKMLDEARDSVSFEKLKKAVRRLGEDRQLSLVALG
jgi:hypothetical protein